MNKHTIYIVTHHKTVLTEFSALSEREAWTQVGRYLCSSDVVIDSMTLTNIGRQACNGVNPYRVHAVQVELP